jgi:hypothetical protein
MAPQMKFMGVENLEEEIEEKEKKGKSDMDIH